MNNNQYYPQFEFTKPFAWNGDRTIPNNTKQAMGRASIEEGFPPETSVPLRDGGIPPHRNDINGILYQLSSYAYYLSHGGIFYYSEDKNYSPSAIVFYEGKYYYSLKENGPIHSVHIPGDKANGSEEYWIEIADQYQLNQLREDFEREVAWIKSDLISIHEELARKLPRIHPIGSISMWSGSLDQIPDGWQLCDGTNGTPNLIDKFVMGVRTTTTDPGSSGGNHYLNWSHNHGVSDPGHSHSVYEVAHTHNVGTIYTTTTGDHTHDYYDSDTEYTPPIVEDSGCCTSRPDR